MIILKQCFLYKYSKNNNRLFLDIGTIIVSYCGKTHVKIKFTILA